MAARSTKTATITLDPSGIVIARILPDVVQTTNDARENVASAASVGGATRRPLLVDISRCRPLEPEVRHFYSGKILVESFLALAILVERSSFGTMMGNVYLRIARPGIPTRIFSDEAEASGWLATMLA